MSKKDIEDMTDEEVIEELMSIAEKRGKTDSTIEILNSGASSRQLLRLERKAEKIYGRG